MTTQSPFAMTYEQAKALLDLLDYDPTMLDTEEDEETGGTVGEKLWLDRLDTLPRCMMPVVATAIRIYHGQGTDPLGLVGNVPPPIPFPRDQRSLQAMRVVPPIRRIPPC